MLHASLAVSVLVCAAGLFLLLVNLLLIPRLSVASRAPAGTAPRVSVVVPARNEERDIEAGVRSQLSQRYPDFEVIVVEDRSTDGTGAILERLSRENPRLRVLRGVEPPPGWLGKPHALAQGAAAASGELLLFVDADVRYDSRALSEAVSYLEARRLDFLVLLPRIEMRGFWENVLMPYLLVAFFQAPGFLANWPRPRWIAAGGGAGNLVRRRVYDAVGGHAALRDSVVDDVRLGFTVKSAGHRFEVVRAEDRIAVRMYRGFREIFDGFTKNVAYIYRGAAGVVVFAMTALTLATALLPAAVLVSAAAGVSLLPADVGLAAVGLAVAVLARMVLAGALGDPLWPGLANPIMVSIWFGILVRSLYRRFVSKRLTWRGRHFEARRARF